MTWTPVVEVRERLTLQDEGPSDAVEREIGQRARLGMEVHRTIVSARVSFQEVRRWTASPSGVVSPTGFSPTIAEGWARVDGALTHDIGGSITVGRQPIELDEGRIVGADDFALDGQFFDALRLGGYAAPFSFEYVNARRFTAEGEDPVGFGVNVLRVGAASENPVTAFTLDGLWVVDARNTADTTATTGAYVRFDTGRWRARAEGYVQSSNAGTGSLVGLDVGWVFGPYTRLEVHARYDGISGDPTPDQDGGRTAWEPVLGDTHRFGGLMERFAEPKDSEARGLAHAQLAIESRPAPQLAASIVLHRFWSPLDGGPYGHELDATGKWSFSPFGAVGAGAAWFAPAPVYDAEHRLYGYLELDVGF